MSESPPYPTGGLGLPRARRGGGALLPTLAAISVSLTACGGMLPLSTLTVTQTVTAASTSPQPLWKDPTSTPTDEKFINTLTLDNLGCEQFSFVNCGSQGERALVDFGKDICQKMTEKNISESQSIAVLMRAASAGGPDKFGLTEDQATDFVQAAEDAYCPRDRYQLPEWEARSMKPLTLSARRGVRRAAVVTGAVVATVLGATACANGTHTTTSPGTTTPSVSDAAKDDAYIALFRSGRPGTATR